MKPSNRVGIMLCLILLGSLFASLTGLLDPMQSHALTIGGIMNISNSQGSSVAEQLAVLANGNPYVIWSETTGGQADVHLAAGENGGDTFAIPLNLTNSIAQSSGSRIAGSADNIYVVWFENSELFFIKGTVAVDGSIDLESQINLSSGDGDPRRPAIAASGNNVYVIWEDDSPDFSNRDIYFVKSTNAGQNFSSPNNLSDNVGTSQNPRIAVSESGDIFVAWQDDTPDPGVDEPIFIRASLDDGTSFGNATTVNGPGGLARDADILAFGNDLVYLVWGDANLDIDIFFAKGVLNTVNGTVSFDTPVNVSSNTGFSFLSQLEVSGSGIVYVTWVDDITGNNDVFIANSTNGGANFSVPFSVSSDANVASAPQPLILPNNQEDLYLAWQDDNVGSKDIFLSEITNAGRNIGAPVNLSNNDGPSTEPRLAASEDKLFLVWTDSSEGNKEVLFRLISQDSEASTISVEFLSDENPKWGRPIEVSGLSNGEETHSITVEWGDGSFTTDIPLNVDAWGPIAHTYDSSNTGANQIVAKLLDSDGIEKAVSVSRTANVMPHATSLTVDSLTNVVVEGGIFSVEGTLSDKDDNVTISNRTISFSGSGSGGIADADTDFDGLYASQGTAPMSPDTLWTLQANFVGDSVYEASVSDIHTFDTADATADQFHISGGGPATVLLEGYNASVTFDNVISNGTLFVSECETPVNERYLSMDICLILSPSALLATDSYAHITMSFANKHLPNGHTLEEIDIFHETLTGFVDITEARNSDQQTVTGRTSTFSKFIVAIALHEAPEEGVLRQQVFVGQDMDIVFNEVTLAAITFDESEYSIGAEVPVTVDDDRANRDAMIVDTLPINVTSSSDSEGISLILTETGNSSGVFTDSFTLTTSSSSSSQRLLHVNEGDQISGEYLVVSKAPFKVVFEKVVESGIVELRNFSLVFDPPDLNFPGFEAIGDAYTMRLLDVGLATDSEMTVIMSYINVQLEGDHVISPALFKVLWLDPDSPPPSFEWKDVTLQHPGGGFVIDDTQKTVTGTTLFPSTFTIGHDVRHDPSGGGGGGGGLPRPGTGILLDATTEVTESGNNGRTDRSRGGGSSDSRSSTITSMTAGDDVGTSVRTESGIVKVQFERVVESGGQLKVNASELASFEELFDEVILLSQDNAEHGIIRLNGSTYSTTGDVFDIDASSIEFDGQIIVTIPYDEATVQAFSDSETKIRLLHYNEELEIWEDRTSSLDETMNTVTGTLDSFSPITAAIILESDEALVNDMVNSLTRVELSVPTFSISTREIIISGNLTNTQARNQPYVMVVQITDSKGVVQLINLQEGTLEESRDYVVRVSWDGMETGKYSAQILVLTDLENPWLLSSPVTTELQI